MPCNAPWLQDFSKDWAEQMIVSVVLVCSEPHALHILHSKQTHASMLQLLGLVLFFLTVEECPYKHKS